MRKPKLYKLVLTLSELELIFAEFNASIENGAKDPDFEVVRRKAQIALLPWKVRATAQGSGDL